MNLAREITGKIRFGKIKTRGGRPVRIVCWNAKGRFPIVALIDFGSFEQPSRFTSDGKHDARENVTSNFDLVIEVEGGEQ